MKESMSLLRRRALRGFLGKGVEKVVVIAFVVLMLLFSALVYLSYRTTDRLLDAMIWVDETHGVIDAIKDFELTIREAESALRSYVITGSIAKRDKYLNKSSQGLQSRLAKIQSMSASHQSLQNPLADIEALIEPRLGLMREAQRRYESGLGGQDEIHQKTTAVMDRLERAFDLFTAEAHRLTKERIAEREAEAQRLKTISLNSVLLGGVFMVLTLTVVLQALHVRRESEEFMRASLEEKNILLKEIHHRVKNNLQIISSLLILQGKKIKDPEAGRIFVECRERIQFMASLHRQLYATGDFTHIDFSKNLAEIAETLIRSHAPTDCKVSLETRIDPLALDIETSQVLGLLVSEILLNALKHAFKGRSAGTIRVFLSGGEMNELVIADDGVGLPAVAHESGNGACAGIGLVEAMAHQIRGTAEVSHSPGGGVRFTVKFPAPDLRKETPARHS